jgi:hypothetical protein
MILRNSILLLILFFLLFTGSSVAGEQVDDPLWSQIEPGIEYRQYRLPDPNNVFVVRMDRSFQNLTLESTIAQGKISEGKETVRDMALRYDQALNYWGGSANPPSWGMRNRVVVAINGSYYNLSNGIPQGGQVQSGWYAKRFDNLGGWSGFAWKLDRSAFIGECVFHFPDRQFVQFPASNDFHQQIKDVNDSRGPNELVLFTPQYNSHTGTDDSGVEVLVEMTRPTLLLPEPAFASGIVRQIRVGAGNSLIPFNSIILSANGSAGETLLNHVQPGDEIRISQEITSFLRDCSTPDSPSWTKTYASIQGAFFFLKNGQIFDFSDPGATERHPRTAILYNDQYIYFLVVDGRDINNSLGMTIHDLALFARDIVGATYGVAQDGGGSSTMVINGQVVNNTYCNIYSCISSYKMYLPLTLNNILDIQYIPPPDGDLPNLPLSAERAVANGMLMVVAEPGIYSSVYKPGDQVIAKNDLAIRLGPGTNFESFASIPMGMFGRIADQMNGLNGVLAKSSFWWYVDFGGILGWVEETAINAQNPLSE